MSILTHCKAGRTLFVSNYGLNGDDNSIQEFTPGGMVSTFATTGLNGPNGLAFDSSGNLYAANKGDNTIERFTPDGVGSVFATTTSPPYELAIRASAVPEPSTFTLALIGGLVSGVFAWSRNRRGSKSRHAIA